MEISKFNDWQITNEEVGLRNLKKIAKSLDKSVLGAIDAQKSSPKFQVDQTELSNLIGKSRKCEIYFHKDLDGVTSALAMKQILLDQYRIECVDCHTIQYGGLEFAVQQPKEGNLAVVVDFAHSKPMFTISTDHHQEQVGAEETSSTYYKHARSNVETISGEIAKQEKFNPGDIELIQTIDSANFLKYGIKPENVQDSIFRLDTDKGGSKNRFMMGFVVNRLLLAYKNKNITITSLDGQRQHNNRNILECMVLDCSPSLVSMYVNIVHYIKGAKVSDKLGRLAGPEEIARNLSEYIDNMKTYKGKEWDEDYKILRQYGAGSMIKPGSYDRYVVFKNNPETEFFAITWPMGLVQVSCNPYQKKRLEDINLGNIAKEVLSKFETKFKKYFISLKAIKEVYETSQDWKNQQKIKGEEFTGIGFRFSDLAAFYIDCIYQRNNTKVDNIITQIADISFRAKSEIFEEIDVIINYYGRKYQFEITDFESIKNFISIAAKKGNLSQFNKDVYRESEAYESQISKKQLSGAKRNISNLLKSLDVIVTDRTTIKVFEPLKNSMLADAMNTSFSDLNSEQIYYLNGLKIPVWELITRNSGGHPSITNISGLNFLAYNKSAMEVGYGTNNYTDVVKMIVDEFINNLKEKIDVSKEGGNITYDTKGIEFSGQETNENVVFKFNNLFLKRF